MQEYRRQIAYLYAYEHGEPHRNAGFVKAEERAGLCRLAIHLKAYCHSNEQAGKVFLYFYHRNRAVGIQVGELERRNGALEWQGSVSADNILGKGVSFDQIRGLWVRRPGGRDYVAEWDDYPVDVNRFLLYPRGGEKCISCPWFGSCERSDQDETDRGRAVYEGSHPTGAESGKA